MASALGLTGECCLYISYVQKKTKKVLDSISDMIIILLIDKAAPADGVQRVTMIKAIFSGTLILFFAATTFAALPATAAAIATSVAVLAVK